MRFPLSLKIASVVTVLLVGRVAPAGPSHQAGKVQKAQNSRTSAAICPVIYPVDESPGVRGYQYVFYGNAFFVNEHGYLLTATHVLSALHGGGRPSILVRREEAPPKIVGLTVIAADREHDLAVLRAVPNPFQGNHDVSYLSFGLEGAAKGQMVIAATLRPSRPRNPHSFDAPEQETSPGEVVDYLDEPLDKDLAPTQIFLFHHEVLRGQSGAPVLNAAGDVVGIVEGRWLHPTASTAGTLAQGQRPPFGAAIPISYALSLLKLKGISWHAAPEATQKDR